MRHATILVAIIGFVPLASAPAQEQLASITRDVRPTTFAAANSVLVFEPGQWGQGPPRGWGCRRWDPCLKGAAIGFFIGAPVGAIIGFASGDDPSCSGWCFFRLTADEKAALGAAVLGGVGAILGYAIASIGKHDHLSVSLGPQRDGRFGLGLSGSF